MLEEASAKNMQVAIKGTYTFVCFNVNFTIAPCFA